MVSNARPTTSAKEDVAWLTSLFWTCRLKQRDLTRTPNHVSHQVEILVHRYLTKITDFDAAFALPVDVHGYRIPLCQNADSVAPLSSHGAVPIRTTTGNATGRYPATSDAQLPTAGDHPGLFHHFPRQRGRVGGAENSGREGGDPQIEAIIPQIVVGLDLDLSIMKLLTVGTDSARHRNAAHDPTAAVCHRVVVDSLGGESVAGDLDAYAAISLAPLGAHGDRRGALAPRGAAWQRSPSEQRRPARAHDAGPNGARQASEAHEGLVERPAEDCSPCDACRRRAPRHQALR
mmetsp:Transcript_58795/g.158432  ORF Transcript_58795/g.158432 Transcript_58795/m.158432 type:complete len:290 (+) Transcript_58795:65-934(+)